MLCRSQKFGNCYVAGNTGTFYSKNGWAKELPQSALHYVNGKEGDEFNFAFWDELNAKLDEAASMDIGVYVMIYGDDEMKQSNFGITPCFGNAIRLFRHVVE